MYMLVILTKQKSRFNYIKIDRYFGKIIYIYNLYNLSKDPLDRKRTESFFQFLILQKKLVCGLSNAKITANHFNS